MRIPILKETGISQQLPKKLELHNYIQDTLLCARIDPSYEILSYKPR